MSFIAGRAALPSHSTRMLMKSRLKHYLIYILLTVGGILLDQTTKHWAVSVLRDNAPIPLISGILELTYVENMGAAFGMMQGRQWFFLILTAIVSAAVIYALVKLPVQKRTIPYAGCLVCVLSGAVGNMVDRVTQGYVVDFIYFKPIDFPVFNIADIFVTCGMSLLILLMLLCKDEDLWWPI